MSLSFLITQGAKVSHFCKITRTLCEIVLNRRQKPL